MVIKSDVLRLENSLKKKTKLVAMLAPSFVVDFSYPEVIIMLRKLGFDKIVEVTYGAKMVNREYHKKLKKSKGLLIATTCPGVAQVVKNKFPKFNKNLALIDSPMIAMGKICRKYYPKHKVVFISPCDFKKMEGVKSKNIDYVVDFSELKKMFSDAKVKKPKIRNPEGVTFDKFYNDYTKVYPTAGGLSKTAHLNGILKNKEIYIAEGVGDLIKFLENPDSRVRFLDATFCVGSCIGGPRVISKKPIRRKLRRVRKYLRDSRRQDIPDEKKGLVSRAKGIIFRKKVKGLSNSSTLAFKRGPGLEPGKTSSAGKRSSRCAIRA
jgi:iron only hydrogenase large subunit-like protein